MRLLTSILSLLLLTHVTATPPDRAELRPDYSAHKVKALKATVDYFEALFLTNYGPIRWKQMQWGWNPSDEALVAKTRLDNLEETSIDAIKPIFSNLLDSTRDAHVSIHFADERACVLPLKIAMIDGEVVVTSSYVTGIQVGDLIKSVNGLPIRDYACQTLYGINWSDRPLPRPNYELRKIFSRAGSSCALPNPDEMLKFELSRKGKDIKAFAFWTYIPDIDLYFSGNNKKDVAAPSSGKSSLIQELANLRFVAPSHYRQIDRLQALAIYAASHDLTADEMAAEGTFEPSVAQMASPTPRFDQPHWLLKQVKGKRIAYFRLPDFNEEKNLKVFDGSLSQMAKDSDALLIDLRDNPGGIDFQCLAFLSRLTDKPLLNLIESKIISEADVSQSRQQYLGIEALLNETTEEKLLHSLLGEDSIAGYHITAQLMRDTMLDRRAIVEEWEAGFTCTRFTPHSGIRYIEPHPSLRYTKPVFVLINENDCSCADYFPAVLKDNERATLMGRTTTGGGGVVEQYKIPNFTGIESFALTRSLLLRNNQLVIEDIGISPHYEFPLTLENSASNEVDLESALDRAAELLIAPRK